MSERLNADNLLCKGAEWLGEYAPSGTRTASQAEEGRSKGESWSTLRWSTPQSPVAGMSSCPKTAEEDTGKLLGSSKLGEFQSSVVSK